MLEQAVHHAAGEESVGLPVILFIGPVVTGRSLSGRQRGGGMYERRPSRREKSQGLAGLTGKKPAETAGETGRSE
jgi:hypothetical protein